MLTDNEVEQIKELRGVCEIIENAVQADKEFSYLL